MPFPKDCYGPETLGLMTQAFAVRDGERDPERLKKLALEVVAKSYQKGLAPC